MAHIVQQKISRDYQLKSIRVQLTPGSGVCIAINYTPFSMAYCTYDSTANCISKKNSAVKRSYVVLEILTSD